MKEPLINVISISVSILLMLVALLAYVRIADKEKQIYSYIHQDEVSRENIRDYNRYANFDNATGISSTEFVNMVLSQDGYFGDIIQLNGVPVPKPTAANFDSFINQYVDPNKTYNSELIRNSGGSVIGINFKG